MKLELKRISIIIFLGIITLFISCKFEKKTKEEYFSNLTNNYNLLKIEKTKYTFENKEIYSMGKPNPNYFSLYGISYFFFIEEGRINMLSIHKNCYQKYKSKQYKVHKLLEMPDSIPLDDCNVIIYPIADFNQIVGDTVSRFDKGKYHYGDWILLEQKEYSTLINDTIYKFKNQNSGTRSFNTIYYIAKQKGIVGMANMDWGVIKDSIGYPFTQQSIKIDLDTIDVSILKYFKNIEKG